MTESAVARVLDWKDPEWVFVELAASSNDIFWLDSATEAGVTFLGRGERVDVATISEIPTGGGGDLWSGGYVGWLDYETGAERSGIVATGSGDPRWLRVTDIVRWDHTARTMQVRGSESFVALVAGAPRPEAMTPAPVLPPASVRVTPSEHARQVGLCRDHIFEGDAYQLCLTTRFTVPGSHDAVAIYRRLRASAPSHHGGFVRIGDTTLVSITPEQFLGVQGRELSTKPIKGTRPRGTTPEADAALIVELAHDEKERAENVMIVDLMRNDLSRVCEPGSVQVPALWAVETYPTVHQLVSTVTGTLRDGVSVGDIWDAAFPAGSMTGAPKLSAMQILQERENGPRGVYAGCFGWVSDAGEMDLAMVIRSVVITPEEAYVGSGGGITWGSKPDAEVAEVGVKARAPLAALGSRCPEGW